MFSKTSLKSFWLAPKYFLSIKQEIIEAPLVSYLLTTSEILIEFLNIPADGDFLFISAINPIGFLFKPSKNKLGFLFFM